MLSKDEICPVCEHGHLSPSTYVGELEYNGSTIRIEGLESYLCDNCGADPVFEDQILRNHYRYDDARRRAGACGFKADMNKA